MENLKNNAEIYEVLNNTNIFHHLFIVEYQSLERKIVKLVNDISEKNNSLKKIDWPIAATNLILKYPCGNDSLKNREKFFDSPSIVSRYYGEFEGCFCIFLPSTAKSNDWKELENYILENKNKIRFIFIPDSVDEEKYYPVYRRLSGLINLKLIDMTYESKKELYNIIYKELKEHKFVLSDIAKVELFEDIEKFLDRTKLNDKEIKENIIYSFDNAILEKDKEILNLMIVRQQYSCLFLDTEISSFHF